MVLQAGSKDHPVRTIWGFLDGASSSVTLWGNCQLPNGESADFSDKFVPKDVSMKVEALRRTTSIELFFRTQQSFGFTLI